MVKLVFLMNHLVAFLEGRIEGKIWRVEDRKGSTDIGKDKVICHNGIKRGCRVVE